MYAFKAHIKTKHFETNFNCSLCCTNDVPKWQNVYIVTTHKSKFPTG